MNTHNSLYLKQILLFIMLAALFQACKSDLPKERIDYLKLYNVPNYPKKAAGRFLKNISNQSPGNQNEFNSPFKNGIKVGFFYNPKHYVDYFKIYGPEADSVGRVVRIEYNVNGLVSRIKYFGLDSVIVAFELFEYTTQNQLNRINRYELAANLINYALASYNTFSFPSADKIEELSYLKSRNFIQPLKDVFLYDANGNVKEKIDYESNAPFPYSSTEFYYNDKKRPFENLGLPVYELTYDDFQRSEILSKNQPIGFHLYNYENSDVKISVGDTVMYKMVYDSLDYPVSKNDSIYYNYIDLE